MKKLIVILLVLCLLAPNVCCAEEEEKPDAFQLLLSLALIGGGAYSIAKASREEEFDYASGILGGLALVLGTSGLIDFSIRMGRAKRGIPLSDKKKEPEFRLNVSNLDKYWAEQYGIDPDETGVVITYLDLGSLLWNLQVGDLIKRLNEYDTPNATEFKKAVDKSWERKEIFFYIIRHGVPMEILCTK